MRIQRSDHETIVLSELNSLYTALLRSISRSADPEDSPEARARLYSPPTSDSAEQELLDDWSRYITPELEKLFQSALETIEADLLHLHIDPTGAGATLPIPVTHLESWIHGLNQAAQVLATRYHFEEEDIEGPIHPIHDARTFTLLQVHFYCDLQGLFLQELEGD